ncbi:MBL fold metallo-hydrolase [Ureibacillus thermosphaericus]|uniref:Glyoxylase-like metal-dependent hydrolase (Beta-lactamase superfamily II) n=1 Tax=Ureibacillus thermosphaericus TaxID=51173 RepID=A0A840Q5N0_URETH|nr:MBL fold metallo-hydrolase [Ureibacillus thermosphaericus]MBB5150266.1 glyoxylase-like metal-dependent hydrolase (beta-lactamase superfamily II) [Ureibacillus thermosphaericus]NKZ32878.1 MBL fold metallo-hydrolase [Ureibacillus thermosphaericus]
MIQYQDNHLIVFESQLYKTTSTVIQTEDCMIVVDPCLLPYEVDEIREHVVSIKGNRPVYLIITHSDWDHIVGAGAFPEAIVIASEAFQLKNPNEILEQVKAFDDEYYIDRKTPLVYPSVDILVKSDGEQLKIGNTTLTFYEAKGHTDDGIFVIVEPLGIWIAGDYLSDIEFPFIYSSSTDYMKTLEKTEAILSNHRINVLVPGHGHVARSTEEIQIRKHDSFQYIKSLKQAIQSNTEHNHLIEPYLYKRGLIKCHEENIRFLLKELKVE